MSRDVLAPPLVNMSSGRCYRVNVIADEFDGAGKQQHATTNKTQKEYVENDLYVEDDEPGEEEVPMDENGNFKVELHVASAFYGGIIGFKGSTKRRIEAETHTEIHVPRQRATGGQTNDITIRGKSSKSVDSARRKINLLVSSLRRRMKPTHFVGVALNFGDIRENFKIFKQKVMEANLPGIDESLWISDVRLHMTFVAPVLLDDRERAAAAEVLKGCSTLLDDSVKAPFDIKVCGLEIMNDDPSAVRVVYARIEAPALQQFANRVKGCFLASGLDTEDFRKEVKLHMTLLNNRYRNETSPQDKSFDAREILKRFGEYDFGSAQCTSLLLHVMGTDAKDTEYYKVSAKLQL